MSQSSRQGAHRFAEFERTSRAIPVPKWHFSGLTGRGRNEHAVVGDLFCAPRTGAEQEHFSLAQFEDHLFVELTHAAAALRPFLAGQEYAVQTAIRDRACVGDREPQRERARSQAAAHAVPDQAWPQIRELIARIPSREHIEHPVEGRAWQLGEGRGLPHRAIQMVDVVGLDRAHGDQLLSQHIQRVSWVKGGLDPALQHAARGRSGRQQIGLVLRHQHALRGAAHMMMSASDALQSRGDRGRRFDLHHQIHRTNVEPELERRGRDDRGQRPGFEPLLDHLPLFSRDRAVVRERDLATRHFIHRGGEAFGQPPTVDEDHRRAMLANQRHQPPVHGRPDRASAGGDRARQGHSPRRAAGRTRSLRARRPAQGAPRSAQRLLLCGVDDRDRARPELRVEAPEQARDLFQWPLRGRQADALKWFACAQRLQSLERQK